ncbi:hypothetical protein MRX96_022256 [Rhipicephalus microplus]
MERLRKKRSALRSQAMKLISEADSSLEAQADEVTLNVLSARLGALLTQLNEVDAAVEPLVPDKEVDENYARTIAYNDRIVACVARLNQQAGAQRANAITAAVASRASRDGNLRANGSKAPQVALQRVDAPSASVQMEKAIVIFLAASANAEMGITTCLDSEICVQDSKICILGSTVSGGCAKCRCPDGGKKCHLLGNKCDCDNGRYYIPGSNRCVLSEKECILDAPASTHCAKCRCPGGGDNCLLIGNKCDCFLGKYYLPGSPRECAKCRCPNEEDHCHLLGNKCECIQGKYYMPDSDQCVRNTDDCILANPVGTRCAQCKCPAGVSSCLLIGNKCNCYNGKYYKSGSDQCVENVEDCVFVNPVRDNCAPCRCPDGGRNCHLYGNKCKCINGQYFKPGSDQCVQDADDCELVNPISSCIPCECGDDKTSCSVAGSSCRCVNGMMFEPDRDVCAEDLTKCEFYTKSSCTPCECGDDRTSCSVAGSSCRCVNGMMYEPDRDVCAEDLAKCEFYTKKVKRKVFSPQTLFLLFPRAL